MQKTWDIAFIQKIFQISEYFKEQDTLFKHVRSKQSDEVHCAAKNNSLSFHGKHPTPASNAGTDQSVPQSHRMTHNLSLQCINKYAGHNCTRPQLADNKRPPSKREGCSTRHQQYRMRCCSFNMTDQFQINDVLNRKDSQLHQENGKYVQNLRLFKHILEKHSQIAELAKTPQKQASSKQAEQLPPTILTNFPSLQQSFFKKRNQRSKCPKSIFNQPTPRNVVSIPEVLEERPNRKQLIQVGLRYLSQGGDDDLRLQLQKANFQDSLTLISGTASTSKEKNYTDVNIQKQPPPPFYYQQAPSTSKKSQYSISIAQ